MRCQLVPRKSSLPVKLDYNTRHSAPLLSQVRVRRQDYGSTQARAYSSPVGLMYLKLVVECEIFTYVTAALNVMCVMLNAICQPPYHVLVAV